jgi:hypothetical protein
MEIHLLPDQEASLFGAAARSGRSIDQLVQEAVALWEEHERTAAEFRASLDEAEASIERGEGKEIGPDSLVRLADDVIERTRARLAVTSTPTS